MVLAQCTTDEPLFFSEEGEELSGGQGTVFNISANAFSFQVPNLDDQNGLLFFTGNSLFNQNWVSSPASTGARDGLGPLFNARSCSGCHFKDGRGRPPEYVGERVHGMLIRLTTDNDIYMGPTPDPNYGGQLQDLAIQGFLAEADFGITYQEIDGTYPDGTSYSLRKPTYNIFNLREGNLTATHFSPRVANHMVGLGLLEAVEASTLLMYADENDADGDGISGRPNYVWNVLEQTNTIGRFGWKANQPTVRQQVAGAFSGDMGLTTSIFPNHNCPPSVNCDTIPNGGTPEVDEEALDRITIYSSTLAVPGRRDWENQDVLQGKILFNEINCSSCHIPKMTTGSHPIEALANQTIRPYTDLLLHDMGDELADNSGDFLATGNEWRTPPLWGIGLFDIVNKHTYYLHDGRARNLEEAILWHGGEAEASKEAFMNLTSIERGYLIQFLESL